MIPVYDIGLARMREPRPGDAAELMKMTNDADVMKYYGMEPYQDIKEAEAEIEWFLRLFREDSGGRWVIADRDRDAYIGDVGIGPVNRRHNRIEIGFKLKKEYWGRGIMSACIGRVLGFGFLVKSYNRIEAVVDPRNAGSKRALAKCGFQYEGLLREYEAEHGYYVDLEMHSILKREYER
jgi:[ribosomal protein S5]-alanine N-acetyltransferase